MGNGGVRRGEGCVGRAEGTALSLQALKASVLTRGWSARTSQASGLDC